MAGSLLTGAVKASELFRYFAGGGTPTPIGRALMELGKLDRSTYLASYYDDELLRRRVNTQLNRQESRHILARRIFHGQKGELRQKYKEGQEDQLSAMLHDQRLHSVEHGLYGPRPGRDASRG